MCLNAHSQLKFRNSFFDWGKNVSFLFRIHHVPGDLDVSITLERLEVEEGSKRTISQKYLFISVASSPGANTNSVHSKVSPLKRFCVSQQNWSINFGNFLMLLQDTSMCLFVVCCRFNGCSTYFFSPAQRWGVLTISRTTRSATDAKNHIFSNHAYVQVDSCLEVIFCFVLLISSLDSRMYVAIWH